MDKFIYENKGEIEFSDCQCEFCIHYNNGQRDEKCPKDLLNKIVTNEIWCPDLEQE